MSDREAFLRAIIASPDDDTPRLVYADWLEENGQGKRAEFIRESVADPSSHLRSRVLHDLVVATRGGAERLDEYLDDRAQDAKKHNRFSVCQNGQWHPRTVYYPGVFWQRGFISGVQTDVWQWKECGEKICRCHPIEWIIFCDLRPMREVSGGREGFFFLSSDGRIPFDHHWKETIPSDWLDEIEKNRHDRGWPIMFSSRKTAMRAVHRFALSRAMIDHANGERP